MTLFLIKDRLMMHIFKAVMVSMTVWNLTKGRPLSWIGS